MPRWFCSKASCDGLIERMRYKKICGVPFIDHRGACEVLDVPKANLCTLEENECGDTDHFKKTKQWLRAHRSFLKEVTLYP